MSELGSTTEKKEKKIKKAIPSLNLTKITSESNSSASSASSATPTSSASSATPTSPASSASSTSSSEEEFEDFSFKDCKDSPKGYEAQAQALKKEDTSNDVNVGEQVASQDSPRELLSRAAKALGLSFSQNMQTFKRSSLRDSRGNILVGDSSPRTIEYQNYQKLREPGPLSAPTSPREFFNCVFCGRNVSPRGGTRVVKKIDLILSYQKEKKTGLASPTPGAIVPLAPGGDEASTSKENETAKVEGREVPKSVPVETSCAECSAKVKSFCNSPRRTSFQREKSSDFSGFSSPSISPILGRSPRGPPSPMLINQFASRSPARLTSLEKRVSNPSGIPRMDGSPISGSPNMYGLPRRSSERGGSFTPPRLMQSKSFNNGTPTKSFKD